MNTIPNLVDELYDVTNAVKDGTKVTKAYVKALPQFERWGGGVRLLFLFFMGVTRKTFC